MSDGTIEENFEEELVNAANAYDSLTSQYADYDGGLQEEEDDFSDVSRYGIVEVVGDDTCGRKIIVVSACKLPANKELDHQRLLRYSMPLA